MPIRLFLLTMACAMSLDAQTLRSPNGRLVLNFSVDPEGVPRYALRIAERNVVLPSRLGLELKEQPSFLNGFRVTSTSRRSVDTTWQTVWGETRFVRDRHEELTVELRQDSVGGRALRIRFRLFDEGLGFRYEFAEQDVLKHFIVSGERTEFRMTGDHTTIWIPGDYDTNEYAYTQTRLSEVDASQGKNVGEIFSKTVIGHNFVQTPVMMKTSDGLYINIFEAALVNYPAMTLEIDQRTFALTAHLAPDAVGNRAYLQAPCVTPWRTVLVSDDARDILRSNLILNLNEPSAIENTAWIRPVKYVGIWWEMHVGTASWNYSDVSNVRLGSTDWSSLKPNGRHGATTERTKVYIDFAAQHGFEGVLVEGWNVGWEDWFGQWKEEVFDFVTPYPDFNVKELQAYAAKKGVKLIMHHETSASVTNYERRLDESFRFMKDHGYDAVKTGYVGRIIPRGEYHDGQWMVQHYVRVAKKAAEYQISVNAHESVRPTGVHRTWPNWLACEAARGNEFNAWSVGNPPWHETVLPFTRLLGGPMDYTPGIFEIKMEHYFPDKKEQVHTTLAKQLALYVTMYSPIQMAADLPENYEKYPDALQFIKDVAVDWDEKHVLEAEPGDFVTIARKARGKHEWFVGAITDENARTATAALSFLPESATFVATIYADGPNAHWEKNPKAYRISRSLVRRDTVLKLRLAEGGGAAVSIAPASPEDQRSLRSYR
ncbi:MAG: glycoside hydrolase family 97 protein [Bacteroidetes bacterium]|jgi:hypothetical protein|nr:glycoside hydrolase family 97 protein [Bacteroidota bacterium]